ncbi:MAG: GtrA family protein [Syntrophomonadaceae bacterium]|nr:GtrA family protein [Syntrophomonadaceae bacterium]
MGYHLQRIFNHILSGERKRLVLFLLVGGLNTIFGYSLYALLLYSGLHYALASLLSTIGGVLFNFKTTGVIVFKNHNNKLLFKFIGVYAITYLLNIGCLRIFDIFNVNMYLAGAIVLIPVALIAYTLQKRLVFGGENGEVNKRSYSLL